MSLPNQGAVLTIAQRIDEGAHLRSEIERQQVQDRRRVQEQEIRQTIVPELLSRVPPPIPARPKELHGPRRRMSTRPPPPAQEQTPPPSPLHEGPSPRSPMYELDANRSITPESLLNSYPMSPKQETQSEEIGPNEQSASDDGVQQLESKIARIEEEVQQLKEERTDVDEEIRSLRDQLREANTRYLEAADPRQYLNQIEKLETALKKSGDRQDELEKRLDRKVGQERKLRDDLEKVREKLRRRRPSRRHDGGSGSGKVHRQPRAETAYSIVVKPGGRKRNNIPCLFL